MSSDATSEEFVKQLAECLAGPISDEDVARFLDAYDQVPASTQEAELVAALLKQARQLPVCSESPTSTPAGQAAAGEMWEPRAEVTIDVQENKFFPTEITLLPGGKVSWAAAPGCHLPQTIELVDDATGQVVDELALSSTCRSQTRTFDSAGEFCFQSNIYTFMRGSISVPTASGRPAQAGDQPACSTSAAQSANHDSTAARAVIIASSASWAGSSASADQPCDGQPVGNAGQTGVPDPAQLQTSRNESELLPAQAEPGTPRCVLSAARPAEGVSAAELAAEPPLSPSSDMSLSPIAPVAAQGLRPSAEDASLSPSDCTAGHSRDGAPQASLRLPAAAANGANEADAGQIANPCPASETSPACESPATSRVQPSSAVQTELLDGRSLRLNGKASGGAASRLHPLLAQLDLRDAVDAACPPSCRIEDGASALSAAGAAVQECGDSSDEDGPAPLMQRLRERYAPNATAEEMVPLLREASVTSIHTPTSSSTAAKLLSPAAASPALAPAPVSEGNAASDTSPTNPYFYPGQNYRPSTRTIAGGDLDLQRVQDISPPPDPPLRVSNSQNVGRSSNNTSPGKAARRQKRPAEAFQGADAQENADDMLAQLEQPAQVVSGMASMAAANDMFQQASTPATLLAPDPKQGARYQAAAAKWKQVEGHLAALGEPRSSWAPSEGMVQGCKELMQRELAEAQEEDARLSPGIGASEAYCGNAAALNLGLAKCDNAHEQSVQLREGPAGCESCPPQYEQLEAQYTRAQGELKQLSQAAASPVSQIAEITAQRAVQMAADSSSASKDNRKVLQGIGHVVRNGGAFNQSTLLQASDQAPASELRRRKGQTGQQDGFSPRVNAALSRWGDSSQLRTSGSSLQGSSTTSGPDKPSDGCGSRSETPSRRAAAARGAAGPSSGSTSSDGGTAQATNGRRTGSGWMLWTLSHSATASPETSGSEGEEYDRSVMAARKQTSSSSRGMSTDGAPAVSARAAPTTRSIGVSTMADSDCFAQQRGSASPPANGDMTWQQAVQAAAAAALPPEWPSAAEDERILPPSVYPADMPSPKLGERIDGRQWYRCRAKQCGRKAFLSDFNSLRCSAQHSGGRKLVAAPDLQPLKAFWSGLSVQEASALVKLTDDAEGRRFLRCMKLEELKGREEELTAEGHPSHIRTGRRAPSSSQYAAAGQLLRGLAMKGLKKPLSADLMFKWLQDAAEGTLLYAFHPDQIPWQLHPAPGAQNIESVFAAHIEARLVKVYQAQREQDALKHRQELEAAEDAAKQRAAEKKAKKLQKVAQRKGPGAAGPSAAPAIQPPVAAPQPAEPAAAGKADVGGASAAGAASLAGAASCEQQAAGLASPSGAASSAQHAAAPPSAAGTSPAPVESAAVAEQAAPSAGRPAPAQLLSSAQEATQTWQEGTAAAVSLSGVAAAPLAAQPSTDQARLSHGDVVPPASVASPEPATAAAVDAGDQNAALEPQTGPSWAAEASAETAVQTAGATLQAGPETSKPDTTGSILQPDALSSSALPLANGQRSSSNGSSIDRCFAAMPAGSEQAQRAGSGSSASGSRSSSVAGSHSTGEASQQAQREHSRGSVADSAGEIDGTGSRHASPQFQLVSKDRGSRHGAARQARLPPDTREPVLSSSRPVHLASMSRQQPVQDGLYSRPKAQPAPRAEPAGAAQSRPSVPWPQLQGQDLQRQQQQAERLRQLSQRCNIAPRRGDQSYVQPPRHTQAPSAGGLPEAKPAGDAQQASAFGDRAVPKQQVPPQQGQAESAAPGPAVVQDDAWEPLLAKSPPATQAAQKGVPAAAAAQQPQHPLPRQQVLNQHPMAVPAPEHLQVAGGAASAPPGAAGQPQAPRSTVQPAGQPDAQPWTSATSAALVHYAVVTPMAVQQQQQRRMASGASGSLHPPSQVASKPSGSANPPAQVRATEAPAAPISQQAAQQHQQQLPPSPQGGFATPTLAHLVAQVAGTVGQAAHLSKPELRNVTQRAMHPLAQLAGTVAEAARFLEQHMEQQPSPEQQGAVGHAPSQAPKALGLIPSQAPSALGHPLSQAAKGGSKREAAVQLVGPELEEWPEPERPGSGRIAAAYEADGQAQQSPRAAHDQPTGHPLMFHGHTVDAAQAGPSPSTALRSMLGISRLLHRHSALQPVPMASHPDMPEYSGEAGPQHRPQHGPGAAHGAAPPQHAEQHDDHSADQAQHTAAVEVGPQHSLAVPVATSRGTGVYYPPGHAVPAVPAGPAVATSLQHGDLPAVHPTQQHHVAPADAYHAPGSAHYYPIHYVQHGAAHGQAAAVPYCVHCHSGVPHHHTVPAGMHYYPVLYHYPASVQQGVADGQPTSSIQQPAHGPQPASGMQPAYGEPAAPGMQPCYGAPSASSMPPEYAAPSASGPRPAYGAPSATSLQPAYGAPSASSMPPGYAATLPPADHGISWGYPVGPVPAQYAHHYSLPPSSEHPSADANTDASYAEHGEDGGYYKYSWEEGAQTPGADEHASESDHPLYTNVHLDAHDGSPAAEAASVHAQHQMQVLGPDAGANAGLGGGADAAATSAAAAQPADTQVTASDTPQPVPPQFAAAPWDPARLHAADAAATQPDAGQLDNVPGSSGLSGSHGPLPSAPLSSSGETARPAPSSCDQAGEGRFLLVLAQQLGYASPAAAAAAIEHADRLPGRRSRFNAVAAAQEFLARWRAVRAARSSAQREYMSLQHLAAMEGLRAEGVYEDQHEAAFDHESAAASSGACSASAAEGASAEPDAGHMVSDVLDVHAGSGGGFLKAPGRAGSTHSNGDAAASRSAPRSEACSAHDPLSRRNSGSDPAMLRLLGPCPSHAAPAEPPQQRESPSHAAPAEPTGYDTSAPARPWTRDSGSWSSNSRDASPAGRAGYAGGRRGRGYMQGGSGRGQGSIWKARHGGSYREHPAWSDSYDGGEAAGVARQRGEGFLRRTGRPRDVWVRAHPQ